jgi:hypothetical protein
LGDSVNLAARLEVKTNIFVFFDFSFLFLNFVLCFLGFEQTVRHIYYDQWVSLRCCERQICVQVA